MSPFRIAFNPKVDISDERLSAHLEFTKGLPRVGRGVHPHPVAVVGGGASLIAHLDELRDWPGEIWAINSMADWLAERGIDSVLFSVDPAPIASNAPRALLASCCEPAAFNRSEVRVFDMCEHDADGVVGGVTTASRAPALALKLGYPGCVFFGCDSSYTDVLNLAHNDDANNERLIVRAAGKDYQTRPELLMQAENLALLIRTFPDFFVNKSEGLLAAMVQDEDWTTVAVCARLKDKLISTNGDIGLYDKPYEVAA